VSNHTLLIYEYQMWQEGAPIRLGIFRFQAAQAAKPLQEGQKSENDDNR